MQKKASLKEKYLADSVQALKDSGARITKPRQAVLQCLASAKDPVSPRQILDIIQKDEATPDIDQVSVYRILEALSELGLVHQVFPSGGYMACFHQHCSAAFHVLTRCSACEKTEELDVPDDAVKRLVEHLRNEFGFTAQGHAFQVNGRCERCD